MHKFIMKCVECSHKQAIDYTTEQVFCEKCGSVMTLVKTTYVRK